MKKFWIQFIVLTVVILGSLFLAYNIKVLSGLIPNISAPTVGEYTKRNIAVGQTLMSVEVADTADKRRVGLSGRDSLGDKEGMLFVFPEKKKYQFWMKEVRLPLDFIFIRDGKVVDLLKEVPIPLTSQKDSELPVYEPTTPIDMLLEVQAGFISQNNIKVGDVIRLIE